MIGYLFLAIALFAGTTKGYCGKKISGRAEGLKSAVFANFIRMLFCIAIGFFLIALGGELASLRPSSVLLFTAALSGATTAVFVVSWLLSVRKSAYMMLDIFLMMGVLIPLIGSYLLFAEEICLRQWIGMGFLFIAVVLMCSYHHSLKGKLTFPALLLLLLCGIANGLTDLSQKLFSEWGAGQSVAAFNFYTYLFSALILGIVFLLIPRERSAEKSANIGKTWPLILLMAVCLFANSYFKTLAAKSLPAAVLYPLNQGSALILSLGMAAIFFKEKITAKSILGVGIAFVGLLLMNL